MNVIPQDLPQSVWKQTPDDNYWKLFYDYSSKPADEVSQKVQKFKADEIMSSRNVLKMGSLVMTPTGIGRLIKLEETTGVIKFLSSGEDIAFPITQILSHFHILLCLLNENINIWYKILVPSNGSVDSLKVLLEKYKIIDPTKNSYFLVFNGKELKEDLFFDQLGLTNEAKLLICSMQMKLYHFDRFTNVYKHWYSYAKDGITFSVNKKIKIAGIGFYGSHESKTQTSTIKIFEGNCPDSSDNLIDESIEIPSAPDQENAIQKVMFKRFASIKPGFEYTVQLASTNYTYMYYGGGGQVSKEAENGVVFEFKYTQGSPHGSSPQNGNFPRFYYYS